MAWPKGVSRAPVPIEVPPGIVEDYKEACLVLTDSPKLLPLSVGDACRIFCGRRLGLSQEI